MPETNKIGSLEDDIEAIVVHLGSARGQRHPNDDRIIAGKIDRAYDRAIAAREKIREERNAG
jgi:hypothetical protein